VTAIAAAETVRPANLAEARDVLLDNGRARGVLFRGAGTKLDWGTPPHPVDVIVETAGLDRLVAHNAADATATVQAGMPLARLQAELARTGQWLAIDPPHPDATVGGVFAANDSGPRRLRYGSMRDLVIGMTMVTSDGAVARSGGQVIKNVAGYDLAKLLCGSLGTLALVAELVVRLHPLPVSSATVAVHADPTEATRLTVELLGSPLVLSAIEWSGGWLRLRVEGRAAGVEEQVAEVTRLVGLYDRPTEILSGDAEADLWRRTADSHAGTAGETLVRAATLPDHFAEVAAAFEQTCDETGVAGELASSVGLGLHSARLRGDDVAVHTATVGAWRRRVAALGGHVVVRRRIEGLTDPDVIWGPPPPAAGLMRSVKKQFDAAGRCAPGRGVSGM
jgi:glycolate oxidase FAD binding subunit